MLNTASKLPAENGSASAEPTTPGVPFFASSET
jgi:hypothetical protein